MFFSCNSYLHGKNYLFLFVSRMYIDCNAAKVRITGFAIYVYIYILIAFFLQALSELHDQIPPFPRTVAMKILEEELGAPLESFFSYISEEPVAAASFGQVLFCYDNIIKYYWMHVATFIYKCWYDGLCLAHLFDYIF
jgi:hypothetical protein